MKNITIGATGPHWRTAAKACFYAERGEGDEYAFGATPADALAKLEKREAAAHRTLDESLAEEIAFLALGAADALKEHRGDSLDAYDGYMGFIGEIIRHAPLLSERWCRMDAEEFAGVWLYDVTERFGREWAEDLLNGTGISPAERLEFIIEDETGKWQQCSDACAEEPAGRPTAAPPISHRAASSAPPACPLTGPHMGCD